MRTAAPQAPGITRTETVHSVRNVGGGNTSELATSVVERGKPFLVVVD